MANLLTAARVVLIFIIIAVWMRADPVGSWWLDLLMVPLLAWAIFMDALDGWAARRFNEANEAGALFDIAGDRIVELALWTFFAIRTDPSGQPLVPLWVPLVMITRAVVTDLIRSVAFAQGRTPFGPNSMQQAGWARQLTASRWSRGAYGGLKAICFCALGILLAWQIAAPGYAGMAWIRLAVESLVIATVVFSIVRAVPVLWDGRRFVTAMSGTNDPGPG
ncbi:MAG: CDP-alcohol phosphatidyltransferase family protein [Gemmatimonadetes bacterium]|nr:CDP-alcohol phosphatidyltransferase family protein [Gemmatimonadota bacterium]